MGKFDDMFNQQQRIGTLILVLNIIFAFFVIALLAVGGYILFQWIPYLLPEYWINEQETVINLIK